jgi:hypothetical protein
MNSQKESPMKNLFFVFVFLLSAVSFAGPLKEAVYSKEESLGRPVKVLSISKWDSTLRAHGFLNYDGDDYGGSFDVLLESAYTKDGVTTYLGDGQTLIRYGDRGQITCYYPAHVEIRAGKSEFWLRVYVPTYAPTTDFNSCEIKQKE